MRSESADFEEVESLILEELERKRQHYRTKAGRTFLLWMVMGGLFGGARHHFVGGLIVGLLVGGLWALYFAWQASKDPRKAPIFDLLRTRAHEIVWIYSRRERREESAVIILGLADGSREEVPVVGDQAELDRIQSAIATRVPWATVGFHHDHERRYFENPASLRRDASGEVDRPSPRR